MSDGLSLQIRGLEETIRHLENGAGKFANDVAFDVIRRLTLEARQLLREAVSGATVDRGFWGKGSPYGPVIGVRTGDLRRSISPGTVYRAGNLVTGVVGTNAPQMKALETGETIRPTTGKYLRIPTKYAQTGAGVDRNAGRSMRDVPGTSVHPSKSGALFIWQQVEGAIAALASHGKVPGTTLGVLRAAKRAKSSEVPLYLLAREAEMPAKHTFRDTAMMMAPRVAAVAGDRAQVWVSHLAAA